MTASGRDTHEGATEEGAATDWDPPLDSLPALPGFMDLI